MEEKERKIRVLIAKPGLDGHDRGAKVVARALMDAGFEVIYTGLRKSVKEIAKIALEEDVDVISLSILSGAHIPICKKLKAELEANNLTDKLWIVGGNIPVRDHPTLKELGVAGIFATGSKFEDIIEFIKRSVSKNVS